MSLSPDEAIRMIDEFFSVEGQFSKFRPEGMSASVYPKALAETVEALDDESQAVIGNVLLDYAMNGRHQFSKASAYLSGDLALRGLTAAFAPHLSRIEEWFASGKKLGWWETDASYEAAPPEAQNAISLMNLLWYCDMRAASRVTEDLLQQTASIKLRKALEKSKLLPQFRKSLRSGQ